MKLQSISLLKCVLLPWQMQAMCLGLRASLGSGWDIGTIQSSDDYALKARLPGGGQGHSHGDTGSKNHLPPYLAVYVWKRLPDQA